jgi:hypothetical protein
VARNFPDVLEFCEEFDCVEDASRMDMQYIKGCLSDVESKLSIVEKEIEKNRNLTTHKEDRYFNISLPL